MKNNNPFQSLIWQLPKEDEERQFLVQGIVHRTNEV